MTNQLMLHVENRINSKYIEKAKAYFRDHNNIKVIGITGSFGKTSVKNILYKMLSEKYKVKMTPRSYNTPLGIALSINELDGDEDYFIVEMGAKRCGDIEYLARIVHPKYGIITGVTLQHIETFKNVENIEKTKYELYRSLPLDGKCIFNGNNEIAKNMYNYSNKNNSILTDERVIHVEKLKIDKTGMTFELHILDKSIMCHTAIIGKHQIDNILLASMMAYTLGVDIENIGIAIQKLEQVPHRFEVNNGNGLTIIDDSYNANIVGVKSAIDTLKEFDGRKIIATQGIVEGGKLDKSLNMELGSYMADVADIAIIIGRKRKYIQSGLMDSGYNAQRIISVRSLEDAKEVFSALLRSGDNLLILNDLPDNY